MDKMELKMISVVNRNHDCRALADRLRNVGVGRDGLKHSLDGGRISVNAPVLVKAGEILSNSIRINELTPREDKIDESYVLIGAARNADNDIYVVRSVVNRFTHKLISVDALYAVNAKKEPVALLPLSAGKPALGTDSTISIAELLDYVNQYFPDTLPEEVLKHYGHDSRPKGKLGKDALYKLPIGEDTSPRALLANAFEGIVTNDIEKRRLQEYKGKVEMLNAEEQKLRELRAEIKELSFAKGQRDTKRIKDLQFDAIKTANRISNLDKTLLRLEAATPLQNILKREKEKAYKRAEQKGKEALDAYRKLNFTGDKNGNLTMHKYFAATACPGPYLESKFPYIAQEVNRRLGLTEPEPEPEIPDPRYELSFRTLKYGSKGEDVKALQLLLMGNGCPCGKWGADGDFGISTENAVKEYQRKKKLTADGIAGPLTWGKLLGS